MVEFRGARDRQLHLQPFAISVDCPRAQVQPAGNVAGCQPAADHLENFQLPVRKIVDRTGWADRLFRCGPFEHALRQLPAKVHGPGQNLADGLQDRAGILLFADVAPGPRPQGASP